MPVRRTSLNGTEGSTTTTAEIESPPIDTGEKQKPPLLSLLKTSISKNGIIEEEKSVSDSEKPVIISPKKKIR